MDREDEPDATEIAREERAIYLVLAILGLPIAIAAVAAGEVFDTGPTLGLVGIAVAVVGLVQLIPRRASRLPHARVTRDRSTASLRSSHLASARIMSRSPAAPREADSQPPPR